MTIKISADPNNPETFPKGFVDKGKLDATTEALIRLQKKEDDEQAKLDALNKKA
jgi:putative transcriptional regulator